jgi:LPS export ABC transporter protein LptC
MYSCENDVNVVRELGKKKPGIEEGKDIESYLSTNGKMRAHLTAPLLLRYQGDSGRRAEFPNSLHVDFFNDSAKVESQLRARYGRYMENENKVYLRDSVVVFNIKGDTLFCEDLYWDQDLQKFYSDKKVTLSRNYRRTLITGIHGMTATQDLSSVSFFQIQPNSFVYVPDSTKAANPVDSVKSKQ